VVTTPAVSGMRLGWIADARAAHVAPWVRSGLGPVSAPPRRGHGGLATIVRILRDSRAVLVDGDQPGGVGWSSTEHGVLAAGDGASRRRQRSPEAKRQDVSASGQLAPRPRWEQPTRCVSVWPQHVSGERTGEQSLQPARLSPRPPGRSRPYLALHVVDIFGRTDGRTTPSQPHWQAVCLPATFRLSRPPPGTGRSSQAEWSASQRRSASRLAVATHTEVSAAP